MHNSKSPFRATFREILSLEQAISYLSNVFEDVIDISDLYNMTLEGKLVLSVEFIDNFSIRYVNIEIAEQFCELVNALKTGQSKYPEVQKQMESLVSTFGEDVVKLAYSGKQDFVRVLSMHLLETELPLSYTQSKIWDLPMLGGEYNIIRKLYLASCGLPESSQPNGMILLQKDDSLVFPVSYNAREEEEEKLQAMWKEYVDIKDCTDKERYDDISLRSREYDNYKNKLYRPLYDLPDNCRLVVKVKELNNFINKHISEEEVSDNNLEIMDSKHEFYSYELDIALQTWKTMFDGVNPLINRKKGKKDQIINYLKKNYKLYPTTAMRIATVVNPNKKGGAPSQ